MSFVQPRTPSCHTPTSSSGTDHPINQLDTVDTTGVSEQYNNTRVFFPASVRIPGTIGCGYKHQIQKHECGRQVIPDTVSSIKSGLIFNGDKLDL